MPKAETAEPEEPEEREEAFFMLKRAQSRET